VLNGAEQRQHRRGTHDVAHALTMSQAGDDAALEIGLDLFRIGSDHLAHHVAMRPLTIPPNGVCMAK